MNNHSYNTIKAKLLSFLNQKVTNGKSEFTIVDFKWESGLNKFIVETDEGDKEYSLIDGMEFVREYRLVSDNTVAATIESASVPQVFTDESVANSIRKTVMESINRLKNDPKFIPQANAIAGQIQVILNMKKIEIELKKLEKKNQ